MVVRWRGGEVAGADFIFQGEEEAAVGVGGGEGGVVEGKEERVNVRDPAEAGAHGGAGGGSHGYAVGEHGLGVGLGKEPGVKVGAFAEFDGGAGGLEALGGFGREGDGGGDVPEGEPSGGELGVVGAPGEDVGLGLHFVDGEGVESRGSAS